MTIAITTKDDGYCQLFDANQIVSIEMFDAEPDKNLPVGFMVKLKCGRTLVAPTLGKFEFDPKGLPKTLGCGDD